MSSRHVFSWLLCLLALPVAAQENQHIGARSAAMGNATVSLADIWSAHHNQAGLVAVEQITTAAYYENRFGLSELGLKGGLIAIPLKAGVLAVNVSSFGYSQFNETKYGLAYALALSPTFSAGVQLDYLQTNIAENYGSTGVITGEVGIRARLSEDIGIGAHVYNPIRTQRADFDDERVPTVFRLGMDYRFNERVLVTAETEKDLDLDAQVKAGLEYQVLDQLFLRTGVSSEPFRYSFGFGFRWKSAQLDFASGYHSVLGFSPQLSAHYAF